MESTDLALLPRTYGQFDAPSEATFDTFLTFTDKQSYIEWRSYWREEYRNLSKRIREMRIEWRKDHEQQHSQLLAARATARSMLALRRQSKVKAERLYQEAKTAEVVA